MINLLKTLLEEWFAPQEAPPSIAWQQHWSDLLEKNVSFYRVLNASDKTVFQQRVLLFLQTTAIESGQLEVTDEDCLLVAASAVIPVWGFPRWHYFNLQTVYLLPAAFNQQFECGKPDSSITGMVGTGPMTGKMVLSRPHLHLGFKNARDKQNVGIHEFVHLIDLADGDFDGFPERMRAFQYAIPWFDLVEKKTIEIWNKKSNINDYGASDRAEFFAVASEYFFERPEMLQHKHPELYAALSEFYHQDVMAIANDIKIRKNSPCPCGSGKKYKRCCMPRD